MPSCVACDTALLPGRPFCGGCGTPVAATPPPAPASAAPTCRCGAPLTGAFCGACGAPRAYARPEPAPYAVPAPPVYSRFDVPHGPVTTGELVRTSSPKSFGATLALAFFLGALGAHWFYLGRPGLGLLRLVTWGATMALSFAAIAEASAMTYDPVYGFSESNTGDLIVALYLASGAIALWTLLDLILVATRSVRDGDGRKLA